MEHVPLGRIHDEVDGAIALLRAVDSDSPGLREGGGQHVGADAIGLGFDEEPSLLIVGHASETLTETATDTVVGAIAGPRDRSDGGARWRRHQSQ